MRTLLLREVLSLIPGSVKAAQCRRRFATVALFLRGFIAQALAAEMGPATRYTLWRSITSIIETRFYSFENNTKSTYTVCCIANDRNYKALVYPIFMLSRLCYFVFKSSRADHAATTS